MANERMVPLLPCSSVDEMRDFYVPLGFEVTYRQLKPNPYLALRRGGLDLHYFGLDGITPEDSYSTCLILVEDTRVIFDELAAGLRATFGKLPLTGFPRITRPRRRKNAGNLSGFALIDPSGNWLRFTALPQADDPPAADPAPGGRLGQALANAIVLADSKGDVRQAAKILDGALTRSDPGTTPAVRAEAIAYLAELVVRLDDPLRAGQILHKIPGQTL